ncbi:MAG: HAD family hydrolase [Muribaculaceae bacterium]|nr:HAD family hydrolase [Muribaculaceae bacterium]MDE6753195.1 HAD family hydrolase [Muribaculaceae bacterium]
MNIDISKIKGVIFDYGGTLDTGGDHWSEVIWAAWQKAGVLVDKGIFREVYVYAERELARTLHILPHHNFNDLLDIKIQIELQRLTELGHFSPGEIEDKAKEIASLCYASAKESVEKAKPVLEQLSARWEMVLVSNFYGNIETVLKDFGIDGYFKKVIESAVVGVRKPDPKIFLLGVEALGLKPEEVLVIGDSYSKDIVPAEKAGCQAIWLKGKGWTAEEDAIMHPNMVASLDEALDFLEGE